MLTTEKSTVVPLIVGGGCKPQAVHGCHVHGPALEATPVPATTTTSDIRQSQTHQHTQLLPPHAQHHPAHHSHPHSQSHPHAHHHLHTRSQEKKYSPDAPRNNCHERLLEVLDMLLSSLIVAPCVIAYWRGTWELMGVLLFPSSLPLSALCSFLIGGLGHFVFTITQNFFKDHIHPDKRRLTYYVISRLYTFCFGIVCVNMWRGAWVLCDWLTSVDSLVIIAVVTSVALMFLIATRTVRNLGAAPYTVTMDHKTDYFEVDTMFKIPGFSQPGLYILDTLFSVFVIGTLVVIAWRGLWGIFDLILFPHDKAKSAWGSLLIGYLTVFVTFIIHPLMRYVCRRINGILKLIICDIYYFMNFFGAVNAWRGIWNLLDVYLYPDNPLLSFWLTHLVPFLLLAAIKCSNSILVRGVFIDADGPGAECVDIPINYVRLHFRRERHKTLRMQQSPPSTQLPHYFIKAEHAPLGKHAEKDKEAQSSLIEKPHATPQIV
ncbi:uncharacterized protein LOC115630436 [Scaptodrosophila lebanonensis]|uniref:Uncharacterized protein LOC115630436 n=1 Tax=Drosophila lebanonensis TaxID=7225 RepID=A0A6J2U4J9_DROLE|nr:uncharacterized protein LOC115630436 [Scaptodrosophila lebanonensis]XP_030382856.1 uncharacterized protein LOC115630436 [Scaptodrosophila lebanonensis]